jgi:hypothetical protein
MAGSERGERFVQEVEGLGLRDPSAGRPTFWLRFSVGLMVGAIAIEVAAYAMSTSTTDPLAQRDALVLAMGGVVFAVLGAAGYVRFALSGVLRFWLARQSFDLAVQTDTLAERIAGGAVADRDAAEPTPTVDATVSDRSTPDP